MDQLEEASQLADELDNYRTRNYVHEGYVKILTGQSTVRNSQVSQA